jgi:glyoxylase-like metal-dependent hydrolase (beta-lactamase superfamily II)
MRATRAREMPGLDYLDPAVLLAELGVDQEAVDHLVLTHLHYDHSGTASEFTTARVVVQQSELDYWTSPWAKRIEREEWLFDPVELDRLCVATEVERVSLVNGDAEVLPGFSVHLVGGHTAGMQVVRVHTAAGAVVLASDASHLYENIEADHPAPLLHSMPGVYAAFDRVKALADRPTLIVPGHDPEVPNRHQPVSGGYADRIVRIA